jgi:hypothetical protein
MPLPPAAAPVGAQTMVPAGAPNLLAGAAPAPAITLCPPPNVAAGTLPAGCSAVAATSPYYAVSNAANAATWNLIDGYLRVEYKDTAGVWHGVTREWLGYGFARGTTPPLAPGANPINPNAILLLQQPADRNGNGAVDAVGIAPACTKVVSGKCTLWTNPLPPEVITDAASTSPWFGVTNAGTAVQSVSKNNWYPINFYDTREGEIRDTAAGNNSCAAAGVMNAVEIDVGNLKKWLWGVAPYGGGSGPNADFTTQNGWVLYFSDRRGMLPNPTALNTKTGDSGLEDSINSASAPGVTDGVLDPIPPGRTKSPEDVNQNGVLDNYGAQNMGLGFYNTVAPSVGNINGQIIAAAPDNPYLPRINSCLSTARKNWVSGARHALKLVDASFGNVPYRLDGTLASPGGFSVASENPVYVQGDYNSNAATFGAADSAGHAAAAVIADSVTLLSNAWTDLNSMAFPTTLGSRNATTSYYRLAIAGGKNINFPKPGAFGSNDFGTDGGVHNFLRYDENWGGQTLNYKGSLVSLYYSTYATGVFKCCTTVYSPPTRAYSFDADFALPGGLPPGTPLFRDVDTLGYRQLFAIRDK